MELNPKPKPRIKLSKRKDPNIQMKKISKSQAPKTKAKLLMVTGSSKQKLQIRQLRTAGGICR